MFRKRIKPAVGYLIVGLNVADEQRLCVMWPTELQNGCYVRQKQREMVWTFS